MKRRKLLMGFLLGTMISAIILALFYLKKTHETDLLILGRSTDNRVKECLPDKQLYFLKYHGLEVASVTLDDKAIDDITVFDLQRKRRMISIDSKEGVFPGEMVLLIYDGVNYYEPLWIIHDDDLDGILDRRIDCKNKMVFALEDIKWKPAKPAKDQPTTTQGSQPSLP